MEDQRDNPNIIGSEIIIYQTEDGYTKIDVKFEDETVWLTQAQLCELYQTSKSNISVSSIFLKRKNWMKSQLFGNSEQLQLMEKTIIQFIIILI